MYVRTCDCCRNFYGSQVVFVCPECPYLEKNCLGYLRVSVVVTDSYGVGVRFRKANPDQFARKFGVL